MYLKITHISRLWRWQPQAIYFLIANAQWNSQKANNHLWKPSLSSLMLKRLKHPSKRLLRTLGFFLPSKKRITQKVNPHHQHLNISNKPNLLVLDRQIKPSFDPMPFTHQNPTLEHLLLFSKLIHAIVSHIHVFPISKRHTKLPPLIIVQAKQQNNRFCHLPRDHCPAYWSHLHHDRSTHQSPARQVKLKTLATWRSKKKTY